jgi:hypothetical protein
MQLLSNDDEMHNALEEKFQRYPPEAYDSFVFVLKANERKDGERFAKSQRVAALNAKRQDWGSYVAAVDRDIARGETPHPIEMKKYEATKRKIAQARAEIQVIRSQPETPSLPAETLAEFVNENRGEKFEAATAEVKLPKGQGPLDALKESRGQRESLVAQKLAVLKKQLPLAQAVAQLTADVDRRATPPDLCSVMKLQATTTDHVTSTVARTLTAQGHVKWPATQDYFDGRVVDLDNATGLVCWLFRDAIIARGTAELQKSYAGEKGISEAERSSLIADLDAQILEEERREEAFIRLAEDAGLTVYRRPLANPLAVLQIAPA